MQVLAGLATRLRPEEGLDLRGLRAGVGRKSEYAWTNVGKPGDRREGSVYTRAPPAFRGTGYLAKFATLEKNGMTKRKIEYWVIPPEQDAEFVACMEDVLETYAEAYDPKHPVLCMDEQPVQLLKETRVPIAATKQHGQRVDYEYERNGTASIFMFAEPLSGFRQTTARPRRTKADWALEVAQLLDTRYADCEGVTLVCDNLNTHTKGAFYEAFEPDLARAYIKRLTFCYTPKHGSWLNVAECELSCLTSQCLSDRRIGELTELQSEIAAWSEKTNTKQRGVDWQFRIDDARMKLKRLYPKITMGH